MERRNYIPRGINAADIKTRKLDTAKVNQHVQGNPSKTKTALAHSEKGNRFSVTNKPPHNKTNKMAYASSKDSDQPGHLPSLIRVFAVCSVGS